MSYNVTAFRVKKVENFTIPVKLITFGDQLDWVRNRLPDKHNYQVAIEVAELGEMFGDIEAGTTFIIEDIYYGGEGSGRGWEEFMGILKNTSGTLVATVVWEGGDTLHRLIVKDGEIKEEDID